jgi:hypothetical protein
MSSKPDRGFRDPRRFLTRGYRRWNVTAADQQCAPLPAYVSCSSLQCSFRASASTLTSTLPEGLSRGAAPGARIGIAAFTSALTSALSCEFGPRLIALLISRLKA